MQYTEVNARTDLLTGFLDAWRSSSFSDIPTYGENTLNPGVDRLDLFVEYCVEFRRDDQVTIAPNPINRTWGAMVFNIVARDGAGTLKALGIRDFIKTAMRAEWYGSVRTMIPTSFPGVTAKGRYILRLDVPFRFDSRNIYGP